MRLVCPNCGAQYEVDDRVIPDGGRDVQCSSCGHAWYQMPANMEAAEDSALAEPDEVIGAADDTADDTADLEPELEPEFEPEPEPEDGSEEESVGEAGSAAPAAEATGEPDVAAESPRDDIAPEPPAEVAEVETAPETEPEAQPEKTAQDGDTAPAADEAAQDDMDNASEDEDTSFTPGAAGAEAPRRELDQNLRAILQDEVAREMAARAADTEPETTAPQSEVGQTEPARESDAIPDASQEPSEGFDGDELPDIGPALTNERDSGVFAAAPAAAAAATDKASRKDLFPDIEEINSTLDSHGPDEDYEEESASEGRGSFGRGFLAIIFIAALALALYLVAPKLAASIPALEPALSGYVDAVNGARTWLKSLLQGVTDQIDSAE